jgi:hypothetical protein
MSSQATPGAMPSHNAPSPEVATDQVLCAACGETGAAPLDLRGAPLVPKCGHVLCLACVQELAYRQCPVCAARLTKNLWNNIPGDPPPAAQPRE